MKEIRQASERGSVLVVALMTITIMTMICATSLYISSQNSNSGMQTAGWQQALTAAESGIDVGIRALNAQASSSPSPWQGWKYLGYSTSTYALPAVEPTADPTPSVAAGSTPSASNYFYYPSSTLSSANSEGAASTSFWVTVDKVGTNLLNTNTTPNQQWYRIRSTGQTTYPVNSALLRRVSNSRLDNDLRNSIAMNLNKNGTNTRGPSRTIEVIVSPVGGGTSIWGQGLLLKNALSMSGGGIIDHFNSNTTSASTFITSPGLYRSTDYTENVIAMMNANGSDLKSTFVYGSMAYSTNGAAPQNTTHVQGSITTPFNGNAADTSDPSWVNGQYNGYTGTVASAGFDTTGTNKANIKITGDLILTSGKHVTFGAGNGGITNYVVWVTGQVNVKAGASVTQDPGITVTWIVDNSITVSGSGYSTGDGKASSVSFVGVAPNSPNSTQTNAATFTVSGSGVFLGTIDAQAYAGTVSGSGNFVGALIANTLNISGGASFHYDDALAAGGGGGSSSSSANYAFASWFEDNSNPIRNAWDTATPPALHPIIY